MTANFAATYYPFSYQKDNGELGGTLYDILNVAAKDLNVTVKYQDTLLHNFNIWLKR